MRRTRVTHLAIALAGVFAVSFWAHGFLGADASHRLYLPYTGTLRLDGAAVNSPVNLTFKVWDAATGGSSCFSQPATVTPAAGVFAVEIGPLPDACLLGKPVYVAIEDPNDGDAQIGGRQRVMPAVAAATSGTGDFDVDGLLTAGSVSLGSGTLSAGATTLSSLQNNGALNATGQATLSGSAVISGGTTKQLDVNGHTETNSLTVTGNATVDGTLTASALVLDTAGSFAVQGEVLWDCPAGMVQVGTKCMDALSRGSNTFGITTTAGNALGACHDAGMELCPLETILTCDQKNVGKVTNSTTNFSCGTLTDRTVAQSGDGTSIGLTNLILTSTPSMVDNDNGFDLTCFAGSFDPDGPGFGAPIGNYKGGCASGNHYFCCTPVNPRLLP